MAMKPFTESQLPASPAGRLAFMCDMLNGFPIYDEDGNDTGGRTDPMITKEQFAALVRP